MISTQPYIPTSFHSSELSAKLDHKNPQAVAGQFEALFYRMMFEQLRTSMEEDPLMGDNEGQQIQQMFHDELAGLLGSKGELGIMDLVAKDIEKATNPTGLVKN